MSEPDLPTPQADMSTTQRQYVEDDVLRELARANDWALSTATLAERTTYDPDTIRRVLSESDHPDLEGKRFDNGYLWTL